VPEIGPAYCGSRRRRAGMIGPAAPACRSGDRVRCFRMTRPRRSRAVRQLAIITGLSGAGRSTAAKWPGRPRSFRGGNLPPPLLPTMADLDCWTALPRHRRPDRCRVGPTYGAGSFFATLQEALRRALTSAHPASGALPRCIRPGTRSRVESVRLPLSVTAVANLPS